MAAPVVNRDPTAGAVLASPQSSCPPPRQAIPASRLRPKLGLPHLRHVPVPTSASVPPSARQTTPPHHRALKRSQAISSDRPIHHSCPSAPHPWPSSGVCSCPANPTYRISTPPPSPPAFSGLLRSSPVFSSPAGRGASAVLVGAHLDPTPEQRALVEELDRLGRLASRREEHLHTHTSAEPARVKRTRSRRARRGRAAGGGGGGGGGGGTCSMASIFS